MSFTREQLKGTLASQPNILGVQALNVIKEAASLDALKALIQAGAALVIYERNPRHPRSEYLTRYLIEATYETNDQPSLPTKETLGDGSVMLVHTILFQHGPRSITEKVAVRLEMFKYLLGLNAPAGENGFRGNFFNAVFNAAFYHDSNPAKVAFAKALADAQPESLRRYVQNDYAWHNTVDSYETLLAIGGDPTTPGALANLLSYCFCSGPGNQPCMPIHVQIAKRMTAAGARLSPEEYHEIFQKWTVANKAHCKPEDVAFLETLKPAIAA
jgi:hypothetical protein